MSLSLNCNFKVAAKPVEYAAGKFLTKFYTDVDLTTQYPSVAEFQVFGDKVDISPFKEGDQITVHFNISGRKWEKDGRKGFAQSLNCWKIDSGTGTVPGQPKSITEEMEDDLPF